jgi:hypothetical protein
MLDHPFRALGTLLTILFAAGFGWAVTLGGYSINDPEIEEERSWVQGFKYDQPEAARKAGLQCKHEIKRSPWTRDGAMELFRCIRAKGEASGHFYE